MKDEQYHQLLYPTKTCLIIKESDAWWKCLSDTHLLNFLYFEPIKQNKSIKTDATGCPLYPQKMNAKD